MTTQKSGSYRYDSYEQKVQAQEFERLYRQASTLLEIERQLWPAIGIVAGKQVLDLGCGSGIITHELAQAVYPAQVTGLDISQALLDKGQAVYAAHRKHSQKQVIKEKITFREGSVYDLPLPEASYDIIYARLLFQHLSEPLEALQNIWRVLKPNGLLCIVDADRDWSGVYPEPKTSSALRQAVVKKQLAQGGDPWVGRKLGTYLKSAGFTQVKTTVTLVDSDQLGLANYFGMLSLGAPYQSGQDELATLQAQVRPEIQALLDSPYAWAGFGLFVVTGRKA